MKKVLKSMLVLALVIAALTVSTFAASYEDTTGHWAEGAIDRWSDYGVVKGKGEIFDPNALMTRAEAAQVFAQLLGLNKEGDLSGFVDANGKWFTSALAKCYAAGIMNGKGNGMMDPEGTITREEFLTMYARAVNISSGKDAADAKTDLTKKGFTDTAKVSNWAAESIGTLVEKGYVNGLTATEIAPQENINRASVMALLDQSISTYVGKGSTETTVTAKDEGITLIANPAVTKVTGTADVVVVAAGAELFNETTGEIEHNDIRVESAKMPIARVQGENITVTLAVNTEAEDAEVTKTGEKSEIVVESTAKVGTLTISAENARATVAGKVETVEVSETAKNTTVATESTASIKTVENKAENTAVTGTGKVETVKTSEDVKVETKTTVENTSTTKEVAVETKTGESVKVEKKDETKPATENKTDVNAGAAPVISGGGSGGGHTHTYDAPVDYDMACNVCHEIDTTNRDSVADKIIGVVNGKTTGMVTLSYDGSTKTVTVTIEDGTKTIKNVWEVIGDNLNSLALEVKSANGSAYVTCGSATLSASDVTALNSDAMKNFVNAISWTVGESEEVKGSTTLEKIIGSRLTATVGYDDTAREDFTITFVSGTPE